MKRPVLVFFTAFCLLFITAAAAAQSDTPSRPRIGLVLGGGGARGAAHVGVLKVLEEQHIPIDYIAGTSMGAIVGGGYAAGLSPEEIEITLKGIDWADLFNDKAPREELSFRHKMDERRFSGLELGLKKGKILLPPGAMAGRKLEFLLKSVFLHTNDIRDFDELDIPFRAVATDIETGNPVVLRSGSLAMAIRASMSIPGAFSPVKIEGQNLVDGFVSKNVPVDTAKDLGAQIVIVVDVGTPLAKAKDLNTMLNVLNQVSSISTVKNVDEQLKLLTAADVLIRPELGETGVTDFQKIAEIIPVGEQAARQQLESLKGYSVPDRDYQAFLDKQRKKPLPPVVIDFIRVKPTEHVVTDRIEHRLKLETGQPLDLKKISQAMDRIQAIDRFESVQFSIITEDGKKGLVIEPQEKSWGLNYLRFGVNFQNDFQGDANYQFLLDYTQTCLNKLGAEWRSEVQTGTSSKLYTEFYQPLTYSEMFFIDPYLQAQQVMQDIYDNSDRIAEYRTKTYGGGTDLGMDFAAAAEARAGLWWGHVNAEPSTGDVSLPDFDVARAGARLRFTYDQVDDANFPRRGFYSQFNAWFEEQALGAEDSYTKLDLTAVKPISYGRHTFGPRIAIGLNPDDDLPYYDKFTLGGLSTLTGYRAGELRGRDYLLGRLMYYYQLSHQIFSFTRGSYAGFTLDWGNMWEERDEMSLGDLVFGSGVFVGADTIVGPLYLAVGTNNDRSNLEFYLSLGQRL